MLPVVSSEVLTLRAFFQLGAFKPASVQRAFKWSPDEAEQLLQDILQALKAVEDISAADMLADVIESASNDRLDQFRTVGSERVASVAEGEDGVDPADAGATDAAGPGIPATPMQNPAAFFLGAVILQPTPAATDADMDQHEIYDGLQRITTLTILIAVLRDMIDDAELKAELHGLIAGPGEVFRLVQRGRSEVLPTLVQPMDEAGRQRRRSPPHERTDRAVYDILRALRLSVSRRSELARGKLARFLMDRVAIAIISTRDQVLARHAFVATNLYGLRLSRDEIFKGELISMARDEVEATEMQRLWDEIQSRVTGRDLPTFDGSDGAVAKVTQMEAFLLVADMLERREEQRADSLGDLIAHLRANQDQRPILNWMAWLNQLARAWGYLERCHRKPELGNPLEREIFRLGCFKWQEWRPLALHWIQIFFQTQRVTTAVNRIGMLHRRCLAMTVLELDADQRATSFREALLATQAGRAVFSRDRRNLPLNFSRNYRVRLRERLLLPLEDHEVRRALVLWYDLSLRTALPGDPGSFWRQASVEHVLPRRPPPTSEWMAFFPDSEERYLHFTSLGNLGLIDKSLQLAVGNNDWGGPDGKQAVLVAKQQHVKYNSMAGIQAFGTWDPAVIRARAAHAANVIWADLALAEPD